MDQQAYFWMLCLILPLDMVITSKRSPMHQDLCFPRSLLLSNCGLRLEDDMLRGLTTPPLI